MGSKDVRKSVSVPSQKIKDIVLYTNLDVHRLEELQKVTVILNNFLSLDLIGNSPGSLLCLLFTPFINYDVPGVTELGTHKPTESLRLTCQSFSVWRAIFPSSFPPP